MGNRNHVSVPMSSYLFLYGGMLVILYGYPRTNLGSAKLPLPTPPAGRHMIAPSLYKYCTRRLQSVNNVLPDKANALNHVYHNS